MPTYDELRAMAPEQLDAAIDELLADNIHEITEDSAFCDCSAGTNADGWMTDDYETTDDPEFDDDDREIRVPVDYHASGEQLEDKGYCGTRITGSATAVINRNGKVSFDDVTAEVSDLDD